MSSGNITLVSTRLNFNVRIRSGCYTSLYNLHILFIHQFAFRLLLVALNFMLCYSCFMSGTIPSKMYKISRKI
ncbi:hypothetical protein VNO80_04359 [Phaseolus coccineus]|uniref:Uncharacterized protein n=1 Tax=Phaseolus coccineus TaxID=3886 RepID=A0AAN9NUR4_PHACN